jgi:DnaJ-class molecular chaperone
VEVSIPAGVDTGSRVRLKGKGQAGLRGGPPGDLYIETHVTPDPVFRREGPHLKVKVPVTFPEAVLGARIEVPTLSGGAVLKVPPGTSSGQIFRLRERGMPALRGGPAGDLLVEVTVTAPSMVDERSKELLKEFQRLNPENPRSYHEGR